MNRLIILLACMLLSGCSNDPAGMIGKKYLRDFDGNVYQAVPGAGDTYFLRPVDLEALKKLGAQ